MDCLTRCTVTMHCFSNKGRAASQATNILITQATRSNSRWRVTHGDIQIIRYLQYRCICINRKLSFFSCFTRLRARFRDRLLLCTCSSSFAFAALLAFAAAGFASTTANATTTGKQRCKHFDNVSLSCQRQRVLSYVASPSWHVAVLCCSIKTALTCEHWTLQLTRSRHYIEYQLWLSAQLLHCIS
jgi:hypothetical protein